MKLVGKEELINIFEDEEIDDGTLKCMVNDEQKLDPEDQDLRNIIEKRGPRIKFCRSFNKMLKN